MAWHFRAVTGTRDVRKKTCKAEDCADVRGKTKLVYDYRLETNPRKKQAGVRESLHVAGMPRHRYTETARFFTATKKTLTARDSGSRDDSDEESTLNHPWTSLPYTSDARTVP